MSDSEALQKPSGDGAPVRQADFTPTSMRELQQFAETVSQSRMVPKKYRGSPQDIVVAVMHGMELGLPPLQALQSVAIINGRPSIYGDAALALVKQSGLCEYVKEWTDGQGDDWTAFCETKRRGEPEATRQSFSWAEAKDAGLTKGKGPWKDYPRRMMQMRARSWCLRDAYPDVLSGLMLAEEAEAIPESNGETVDPKEEMHGGETDAQQLHAWEGPTGSTYMLTPGKVGSLDALAEALEEQTGDELAANIEKTRAHWDWKGEADTALDALLCYHAQRLADEEAVAAEEAAAENEPQDPDEVKAAAEGVETASEEANDPDEDDSDLPF